MVAEAFCAYGRTDGLEVIIVALSNFANARKNRRF